MKHLLKYLLAAAALPLWGQAAAAGPFGQLRGLCEPGKSVLLTVPTVVEGIVVSDYRSPNMELNPNLNYYSVDLEENDRTVYVEAADGSCGIRLRFDEASENRLARYDRVRLDLNGCRLTRTAAPDCMTLTGVQALNVLSVAPGTAADLPVKERSVATLTDDDLYTFVTLRDAEFVFKEGSYTNIWEPYAQSCGELHHYKYDINNRMDGWASLEFELLGYQNLGTEGRKGDRVLNDAGSSRGYLWTDCGAFVYVDGDYNALGTQNKGWVGNGAVVFKAPVPDWYKWDNMGRMVGSNAFYIAFSTKKARGTALQLAFEWGAGNQDGNFSWNFPLEWKAEYAVDGGEFQPLRDAATGRETFVLRSLPWWDKVIDGSGHADRLRTPYDCGMGLQQRIFRLPAEAFGRDEVVVRLSPASGLLSQIRGNPSADVLIPTSVVRKNSKQTTVIRFGTITVDYK